MSVSNPIVCLLALFSYVVGCVIAKIFDQSANDSSILLELINTLKSLPGNAC